MGVPLGYTDLTTLPQRVTVFCLALACLAVLCPMLERSAHSADSRKIAAQPSHAAVSSSPSMDPAARKNAEMERLNGFLEEEQRLMTLSVRILDRASARLWLSSFISAPPLNCPSADRDLWIETIIEAVEHNELPICKEILGLVACIISIESSFQVDPLVVDPSGHRDISSLLQRAEEEFHEKMGPLLSIPPVPMLYERYKQRFYPQLLACRTEGQVEAVARNIASDLKNDAAHLPQAVRSRVYQEINKLVNVVRTKGSMQLSFKRASHLLRDRGDNLTDEKLTEYMYTRTGGVDVGVAALKAMFVQYAAYYATPTDLSWLFFVGMDYHYGPFSSRNMMEQIRIRDLSGMDIPLDGDFLHYDGEGKPLAVDSKTLQATLSILASSTPDAVFGAFLLEKDPHYIYTDVHRAIAEAHLQRFGETPFAVIGELWTGREAMIKHGSVWRTKAYLNKLDRYLNAVPWDEMPVR